MGELRMTRCQLAILMAGAIAGGMAVAGTAFAVQTHMVDARAALNSAYYQLSIALADKAGHRVKAMNLVQEAIGEVNAGIEAGAR